MNASKYFYEGRFSGAILTSKRMDSAGLKAKVDIAQNLDRSEALADIAKLDDRRHAQPPILGRSADSPSESEFAVLSDAGLFSRV